MTDIALACRNSADYEDDQYTEGLLRRAAEEIERLRKQVQKMEQCVSVTVLERACK